MRAFFSPDQHLHNPRQFMRVGRISDPTDLPARVDALLGALAKRSIVPELPPNYGQDPALAVHTAPYVHFLKHAWERWKDLPNAGPEVLPNTFPYWNATPDQAARPPCPSSALIAQAGWYMGDLAVPIGPDTWRSVLASSHSATAAADAVLAGSPAAYALCRPSGHHARADRATGFCYLNNSAIAAQRLRKRFQRVVVLDVDTHHGDGTQQIFYTRGDVLTISIHVNPEVYNPYFTGFEHERGHGHGEGANLNIVLEPGMGDDDMMSALERAAVAIREFGADAMVVALGYDTHKDDPLGLLKVTTEAFYGMGQRIRAIGLPTVVVQEGGYQISVIGDCLGRFLDGNEAG